MLHFIVSYFVAFKLRNASFAGGGLYFSEVDVHLIKCQINRTMKDKSLCVSLHCTLNLYVFHPVRHLAALWLLWLVEEIPPPAATKCQEDLGACGKSPPVRRKVVGLIQSRAIKQFKLFVESGYSEPHSDSWGSGRDGDTLLETIVAEERGFVHIGPSRDRITGFRRGTLNAVKTDRWI